MFATSSEAYQVDHRRTPVRRYSIATLQARDRLILALHVQGLKGVEIVSELAARGCSITSQTVSNVLNSPIAKSRIEDLCNNRDIQAATAKAERDAIIADAQALLSQAVNGVLTVPTIKEDGSLDEENPIYQVVPANARIKAATEVLNRHPETAPVTRQHVSRDPLVDEQLIDDVKQSYLNAVEEIEATYVISDTFNDERDDSQFLLPLDEEPVNADS